MKRGPKINIPIQLTGRRYTPSHRQRYTVPCPAWSSPSSASSSCHESCPGLPKRYTVPCPAWSSPSATSSSGHESCSGLPQRYTVPCPAWSSPSATSSSGHESCPGLPQRYTVPCPACSSPSSTSSSGHESCSGLPQGGSPSIARSTRAQQPETRRQSPPPGYPTSSQRRSGMSQHTAVPQPEAFQHVSTSTSRSSSPMHKQVSRESQRRSVVTRHTAVPQPEPSRHVSTSTSRSSSPVHKQVSREGDEPDEIQPEIAAAMMYAEERGLHFGGSPQHVFSYLFETIPAGSSPVDILPAQSGEAQVIPVRLSAESDTDLQASVMQQQQSPPDTDFYSTSVKQQASDYYLEPRPPAYFNRFQLRGSQLPSWFPGYFEVTPHTGGNIRLSKSPSTVLQTAWKSLRPEAFPHEAIILR